MALFEKQWNYLLRILIVAAALRASATNRCSGLLAMHGALRAPALACCR
jgi:hypothetical protein